MHGTQQPCETPIKVIDIILSLSFSEPVKLLITSVLSEKRLIQCNGHSMHEQLYFRTILTKEQVNAIEEYRQEGSLKLHIELSSLISSDNGRSQFRDDTDLTIPRESWLEALEKSGYRRTLLFEVPLPSISDYLDKHLSKAQECIEIGHYKEAVLQCRRIIEYIEKLRNDKKQAIASNKKAAGNKKEREIMTVIERMLSLREQLKNICQLGGHDSDNHEDGEFTRSQARVVLGMTMTLLAEPTVGFSSRYITEKTE